MNAADQIARWIAEKGITDIFGVIGSGNLALWSAITRFGKAKIHCFHHEQAAAQAAVFYYRTTNEHAAVLVTTGAGSSNVVTGILCAWMDSVPLLVIAGNEPTYFITQQVRAKGAQGYNFVETLKPITKKASRFLGKEDLWELDKFYESMMEGRKGPVVIEIPSNIQNTEMK